MNYTPLTLLLIESAAEAKTLLPKMRTQKGKRAMDSALEMIQESRAAVVVAHKAETGRLPEEVD